LPEISNTKFEEKMLSNLSQLIKENADTCPFLRYAYKEEKMLVRTRLYAFGLP